MNQIPLYIVTSFLSTGKTAFINRMTKHNDRVAVIAFKEGMQELTKPHISVSYNGDGKISADSVQEVVHFIETQKPDALWLEWNGMAPHYVLEDLLYGTALSQYVKPTKLFYVTDSNYVLHMLGRTGEANLTQLANADVIIHQDAPNSHNAEQHQRAREILKKFRNDCPIMDGVWAQISDSGDRNKAIVPADRDIFILGATLLAAYGFVMIGDPGLLPTSLHRVFLIVAGIILQAFPFLTVGILASSLLRFFVPTAVLERILGGNPIKGFGAALIGGVFLPLCDCATIPLFKSLTARRIAVPIGLTFLLAAPLVNPIVILSTYYAFDGNPWMVGGRLLLGCVVALLTAFTFIGYKGLTPKATDTVPADLAMAAMEFRQNRQYGFTDGRSYSRLALLIRHGQREFAMMGKFLLLAAFLSALFQVYGVPWLQAHQLSLGLAPSMAVLMVLAFLLSLCATSDAMVARSLAQPFAQNATLAFLVFGPMIDLKNVLMLASLFPKRFVWRLAITVAIISFAVVYAYALFITGKGV